MHRRRQSPTSRQESEMATKSLRELQDADGSDEPMQRLRSLCLSRGASGILGLGRMFRRMDHAGKKQLNQHEFIQALRKYDLELSDDEASALFRMFDDHNSGYINVTDFLEHLRPPMSESRTKVVEQAFRKMDKTGDGFSTLEDLKNVYNVKSEPRYISGEESEETILKRFLAHFEQDATKDGQITHEEFFDYYSAVSASIDNDCYFNLMMCQAYKL